MSGEGGIRTPDPSFSPDNCLAGSPVRPLQHLSENFNTEDTEKIHLFLRGLRVLCVEERSGMQIIGCLGELSQTFCVCASSRLAFLR